MPSLDPASLHLPGLELYCFGAPRVHIDGHPAPQVVTWRKHLALLVYLALTPDRTRARRHLVGLLWPEKDEARARRSLNQAITLLRAELGNERLVSKGESLSLNDADLRVDALEFQTFADQRSAEIARFAQGAFLEGFVIDDAPAFEEWASNERRRLGALVAAALVATGEEALTALRYVDAISHSTRALHLEPFSEPAVRLLVRSRALSGDIAGALEAYEDFSGKLTRELSAQPSRELHEVSERVRSMRWRRFSPVKVEEEPPLVGRDQTLREAFALLDGGLTYGPVTLFISGDPGTGRTRFLVECAERLALAGAVIAMARPLEVDQDTPWSTLRALLRAGLLRAPGSPGCTPEAIRALNALEANSRATAAEVSTALGSLLMAVAEEQPVALLIDDAHYSDGQSLASLRAAVETLRHRPFVLLVTALHSWDRAPHELLQLSGTVGRGVKGRAIHLAPLSETFTRQLVASCSPWCRTESDRERLGRRVFFETSGNPFLAVTLLRGLAEAASLQKEVLEWPPPGMTDDGQLPISVSGVGRSVLARIAEMDEETRQILQAASIGGPAIDLELVSAITGSTLDMVQRHLGVLERRRFVTFDGERYAIAAPLLAEIVRSESLPPGELHALRSRAISCLEARADPDAQLLRVQLLTSTAPGPAVFDESLVIAQRSLSAGRLRAARTAVATAMRSLPANDVDRNRALEGARLRVKNFSENPPNIVHEGSDLR